MTKCALDLNIGESGIVKSFADDGMACKLLTVGIIPETKISMVSKSPFGGAYCLKLGKTLIAIRKSEAKTIIIE